MTTPNIEELRKLAEAYANAHATYKLEDLYGSSKGYTAQCKSFSNEALAKLLDALQSQAERIKELNLQVVSAFGQAQEALEERDTIRAKLAAIRAQEPVAVVESDAPGGIAYTPAGLELVDGQELYASPAGKDAGLVADNLRDRCAEILDWKKTGILANGALRIYAESRPYSDRHDCLQIAEAETANEAFEYIAASPKIGGV